MSVYNLNHSMYPAASNPIIFDDNALSIEKEEEISTASSFFLEKLDDDINQQKEYDLEDVFTKVFGENINPAEYEKMTYYFKMMMQNLGFTGLSRLSGVPINMNDILNFINKQMNLVEEQQNTTSNILMSATNRIRKASHTINSAYKNTLKDSKTLF